MKVKLVVVPPGGGEADYSIFVEMPGVPQAGDYVGAYSAGASGMVSLIVKRTWWTVEMAEDDRPIVESGQERYGKTVEVAVECYPADGPYNSEEHKRVLDMYEVRGKGRLKFDASMY